MFPRPTAMLFVIGAAAGAAGGGSCVAGAPGAPPVETPPPAAAIDFNEHIRPLLAKKCVSCHGGPKRAGGVSLLRREDALAEGDSGVAIVVPGDPAASYLIRRVADPDDALRMPPAEHGARLSDGQIALLRRWVRQGAPWAPVWSMVPPHPGGGVRVELAAWPRSQMDRFVLRRLEQQGLAPSPEAPRGEWLRRATFDLTGLPPTDRERRAFAADRRPGAYERVVDRLLASPRFGERWAAVWLDLARYADTMGYERDPHRDIWPWRDWLIRSLNADLPYDELTIKMLAGDLLPHGTIDDRLATAFHRNTPTNVEGGTDDEEFRTAAVIDRVNTTWRVWMGGAFGCAQCHDHPHDAFSQRDYYRFLAFFNTTRDSDVVEELPRLAVPLDRADNRHAERLDRRIAELRAEAFAAAGPLARAAGPWRPLRLDRAASTGSTELRIDDATGDVIVGGTITDSSRYTLEGPAPRRPVTALRIEAMPRAVVGGDAAAGMRRPEVGFVLSRLRLEVLPPGGAPREVHFAAAVADEPAPAWDPADSLRDNTAGWAAYSRLYKRRWVVFVLDEPLGPLPVAARLRLTLKHNRNLQGQGALVLRRAAFSVSSDPAWGRLIRSKPYRQRVEELAVLRERRRAIASVATPVMQERHAEHARQTFVFTRGDWLAKGARVAPGTPACMPALQASPGGTPTRLDLARWIASPRNPLTSRTAVNRVWARLFGTGIVETEGDLGAGGAAPTHPRLLDWLAVKFSGDYRWRLKPLLRQIVLSATYRQASRVTPQMLAIDPHNRMLTRGPRRRLSAEMVRDQALVLSGRMSSKMFGPPVMPPQPEGVWRSVYSGARWRESPGEDRYRRAVYTYWKRTAAYPSLMTFDTPSREVCTVRRVQTNTPLQALVTLNDPAFVELARGFAERIAREGGDGTRGRVAWAYRAATGEAPHAMVVDRLAGLHSEARARYARDPAACRPLGGTAEAFALTIVASTVMNLDEALTR